MNTDTTHFFLRSFFAIMERMVVVDENMLSVPVNSEATWKVGRIWINCTGIRTEL